MLAAGLVGGLNPCALSMLLLLLTVLFNLKANAVRCAAVFLCAKFVTYLLIGTLLLGAFQAWNPQWLQLAAKIALTALAAVLILFNLRDAWMARRERYGEIINQLPAPMRRGLQARIHQALERPFGPLTLMVAMLGVLVAAGEFLCAGQVYLATLLAAIQTGNHFSTLFPMLVGYCLMFIAPSAVLSFTVARGQALHTVSEFVRRRMPLIKLVTALFLTLALIYAWVV
jgi:cytochrome c biogenesis protein CcdA